MQPRRLQTKARSSYSLFCWWTTALSVVHVNFLSPASLPHRVTHFASAPPHPHALSGMSSTVFVHPHVMWRCDNCGQRDSGLMVRWRCVANRNDAVGERAGAGDCTDFDLCSTCHEQMENGRLAPHKRYPECALKVVECELCKHAKIDRGKVPAGGQLVTRRFPQSGMWGLDCVWGCGVRYFMDAFTGQRVHACAHGLVGSAQAACQRQRTQVTLRFQTPSPSIHGHRGTSYPNNAPFGLFRHAHGACVYVLCLYVCVYMRVVCVGMWVCVWMSACGCLRVCR